MDKNSPNGSPGVLASSSWRLHLYREKPQALLSRKVSLVTSITIQIPVIVTKNTSYALNSCFVTILFEHSTRSSSYQQVKCLLESKGWIIYYLLLLLLLLTTIGQ
jgi:hypothetical protein